MTIKLNKPLCFFDLETTGINISKDRIVEISILKVLPNQSKSSKTWRVNPTIPIPQEVTEVHGISDEDVADKPTFKEIAKEVNHLIKNCDLAGFNSNRFDIPLLAEEMLRADVHFDMKNRYAVDVQTIFHKMEKRTLEAAYMFYCNKTLENAHAAEADTMATYEVLEQQLERYSNNLENNIPFLSEFSMQNKCVDFAGYIQLDKNNEEIFSFGKYKNQKITDVLKKDPGYYAWIQKADFPLYTKKVLTSIKLKSLSNTE